MENKKLCIQKATGDNFFKADTILLGGTGIKKFQPLYHKAF